MLDGRARLDGVSLCAGAAGSFRDRDGGSVGWEDSAPQVLSALTNVVFVILFALWLARQSLRPGLFVRVALACFLLNLYWFVHRVARTMTLDDLLIGYYVWLRGVRPAARGGEPHRFRKPSNIENTHGRHAIMSATLRFSRLGQVTVEIGELVEIRGQPRELALQNLARSLGQLRRAEMQRFVLRLEARTHELFAHLLLVGAADRAILAPRDGRMHAQARAEPRAQLHQVQVVELHQPAAQQLFIGAELGRHFARRVAVGQQIEAA